MADKKNGDLELRIERKNLRKVREWLFKFLEKERELIEEAEKDEGSEFKKAHGTYSQDYENAVFRLNAMKKRLIDYTDAFEKPYFGRIDFRARTETDKEEIYIGKHSIMNPETADSLVTDWRAPVSDLYYSGTVGRSEYRAPGGFVEGDFTLKRRFTYTKESPSDIDMYFDEGDSIIAPLSEGEGDVLQDEFLRINLEESTGEKLKEIVATIAKEQNEIIRAEKNIPIILQGAAGAGKTTVALHRLSYLLYKHRDTIKDMDVCIVAPNKMFLEYISEVLPDLGSHGVVETTFEDLVLKETGIRKYSVTKDEILKAVLEGDEKGRLLAEVSSLKGKMEFIEVVKKMADDYKENLLPSEGISVADEILYTSAELERLFISDLNHMSVKDRLKTMESYCTKNLKDRREKVSLNINSKYDRKVRVIKNIYEGNEEEKRKKIIETYDERDVILKSLPQESKKVLRAWFKKCSLIKPYEIYASYMNDREFLVDVLKSQGLNVSDEVMDYLTSFSTKNITADDLGPILYLKILIEGPSVSFSHMVVDEAQDYSVLEIEAMRKLTVMDSLTLVGDLAQGIYSYRGIKNWSNLSPLFKGSESYRELKQSYRSTVEIIEEGNKVLEQMDNGLNKAIPVLRHGRKPERIKAGKDEFNKIIERVLKTMEKDGRKTLAVVTRTLKEAEKVYKILHKAYPEFILADGKSKKGESLMRVVMPSYMTKGLEFDCVVIDDEGSFTDSPLDLSLKYVSLTRALHLEYIVE